MLRQSAAKAKAALDRANAELDETLAYFRAKHEAEADRAHETGRTA